MKRLFLSLIIVLAILAGCGTEFAPLASAYALSYEETDYTYDDIDILVEHIAEQISNMEAAHQMAEAARHLGYEENHPVIKLAGEEWIKANTTRKELEAIYDNLIMHWQQKEEEYPVATYIWSYLKDLGYSNQVCAGILGNIMAEVGGNTLNIQATIYGDGYYGMCQWNRVYSDIWGASLEQQCDYLKDTIQNEFRMFASVYRRGFSFDQFLELSDPTDAALAFAKVYERCGSGSHRIRQENAIIAYNYFVGE